MSGLFDHDQAPLFPDETPSKEVAALFPEQGNPAQPRSCEPALPRDDLSAPPLGKDSSTPTPLPLLPEDPLDTPPLQQPAQSGSPTALPPDRLDTPPPSPETQTFSTPALPSERLDNPPRSAGSTQPSAAFGEPDEDPLIAQALRHLSEKYPDDFSAHKGVFRSQLATLLPLTFDRISSFSEAPLRHVQVALQEVTTSTQNFSAVSVSAHLQEITNAARRETQGSTSHGLGGLLQRVGKAVKPFDPAAAHGTLARLSGDVQIIHQRLAGIDDLAKKTLTSIQLAVQVLSVIQAMAENTEFANQVQRRYDLFLTTGQELQMAIKQTEQLQVQTEQALMQIEEVKTVTLPSLGFLGSIS